MGPHRTWTSVFVPMLRTSHNFTSLESKRPLQKVYLQSHNVREFLEKKYKLEFTKTSYRLSLQAHRPMSGIPYVFNVFFWKCTSRAKKVNFISNEFNSGTVNSANLIYRRSLCSYISMPHFSFLLFKHMSTG